MRIPEGKTLYPLSDSQKLLRWTEIFSLEPTKTREINIISFYIRVTKDADPDALEKALNHVIAVNDSLRLRIVRTWRGWRQYIADPEFVHFPRMNVSGDAAFQEFLKNAYKFPVPWLGKSLVWARLVQIGAGDWALVMRMHHAVMDGYSIRLICQQLQAAYHCYLAGEAPADGKRYSILDFFKAEKKYSDSPQHEEDRKFWSYAYNHQRHYSFPAGHRSEFGACASANFSIEHDLYQRLSSLAQASSCSLLSLLMSMVALTTYVATGKDNFALYSLTHGRHTFAQKKTVGCMMNTVPIFYDVDTNKPVSEQFSIWYMNYLDTLSHGRLTMGEQVPLSYKEPIKHFFNFNHGWMLFSPMEFGSFFEQADMEMEMLPMHNLSSQFYLSVLDVPGEHVRFSLDYQTHKFKQSTISKLTSQYLAVCQAVADDPSITPKQLRAALTGTESAKKAF